MDIKIRSGNLLSIKDILFFKKIEKLKIKGYEKIYQATMKVATLVCDNRIQDEYKS